MRLFRNIYIIDLRETNLILENLDVNSLEQVYNLEIEAFQLSSLGFFNEVVAKFEKPDTQKHLLLKIELPKKSYYLQLIPIAFFLVIGLAIMLYGEYKSSQVSAYIVYIIPIIIVIMGFIYQQEFLKKSKNYLNEITRTFANKE